MTCPSRRRLGILGRQRFPLEEELRGGRTSGMNRNNDEVATMEVWDSKDLFTPGAYRFTRCRLNPAYILAYVRTSSLNWR